MKIIKGAFLMVFLSLSLSGCGGGASDSGAGENAIENVDELVGVYMGEETVLLISASSGEQVDMQESEVSITVNSSGQLQLSTTGGTSGTAQITNARMFLLKANAQTQFDGQCTSGTIVITGNVTPNDISAEYSSDNLICNGETFRIEGNLNASR